MANVAFAQLIDFNMSTRLLAYQSTYNEADHVWVVGTPTAAYQFEGSGLQYDSGAPAGGTVTGFAFFSLTTKDVYVTGLSLDFALMAPLFNGGLDASQQTNLIWRLTLGGDDTIDFGANASSHVDIFAGDGRHVEVGQVLYGGQDSFLGNAAGGSVYGDYVSVLGVAYGGNDDVNVSAYIIDGDADRVYAGALLIGGNDALSSPGTSHIIGDAYTVEGTLIGGNDTIDATNSGWAYGDANYVYAGAAFVGGDDRISAGGSAAHSLVGDAYYLSLEAAAQGGDDTIIGGGGGDTIYGDFVSADVGYGGNDVLYGGGGADTLYGGGGNDTISGDNGDYLGGADGADSLYGEAGNDTLSVTRTEDFFGTEVYDGGTGTDTLLLDGSLGYDFDLGTLGARLVSIEVLKYGYSYHAETTIRLNASQFGAGLSLTAAIVGTSDIPHVNTLIVTMGTATSLDLSGLVFTNFSGAGEFVVIVGSSDTDTITGTHVNDSISGGDSFDTLLGGDGNDTLSGGLFVNSINGGNGNDVIKVQQGELNDNIDGGNNIDTLDLSGLITDTANVDLQNQTWSKTTVGESPLSLSIISVENVIGGGGNDTILGNVVANSLDGGAADDILRGGGGKDTMRGGAGSDILQVYDTDAGIVAGEIYDGGTDTDTLYLDNDPVAWGAFDLDLSVVTLVGIERLDMYSQHDGAVAYTAIARFNASQFGGAGLSLNLEVTAVANNPLSGGEQLFVTMGSVTALNLSGLTFNSFADVHDRVVISGGTVAANIIGSKVDNSITGGAFNDTIRGGLGNDTLNGGGGTHDTLDYSEKSQAIVMTLGVANVVVGGFVEDTAVNFENVIGGSGADELYGNTVANALSGGIGNDWLSGGLGNDTLNGGANVDTADFSDKATKVTATLVNGAATVVITATDIDSLTGIENLNGGTTGDALTGDIFANQLDGNNGNDTLKGGLGNDLLNGGAGLDTADFSDKTTKVTATLVNGNALVTITATDKDTLTGIENLTGGTAGDGLTGDVFANLLKGNNGADTLNGGLGKDTLDGGTGADKFLFKTALNATTNVDTIVSFTHDSDVIQLSKSIFKNIGTLDPGEFYAAAGAVKGHDADDRIIYNKTNGRLYFDDDGNKAGGHAAILFAVLTNKPAGLDAGDFLMI